jgi:DedD protein
MDEKLKHRLIGLAVIISLGAIFAPAVMKKSSQRLDGNFSVNVKLPPKPIAPNVVTTDENELFKTIKVAKVTIPSISDNKHVSHLVKAESIKSNAESKVLANKLNTRSEPIQLALNQAATVTAKKSIQAAVKISKPSPVVALKAATPIKPPVINKSAKPIREARASTSQIKKDIYAVQLASFTELKNAQTLVEKLKSKGFQANFAKMPSQRGTVYKVYAGHSPRKIEVIKLKSQLASTMQINGFIVTTGVS